MKQSSILLALLSVLTFALSAQAQDAVQLNGQKFTFDKIEWTAQVPDVTRGAVAVTDKAQSVRLSAFANTDMWNVRNAAPIAFTPSPEGNFAFEACVTYDAQSAQAVAGITVFSGGETAVPRFTYGLDQWNGTTLVKFQGLPPSANNPATAKEHRGVNKVWLRLECYRKALTNRPADLYIAKYKLQECADWTELTAFAEPCANDVCALFIKSNAPRSAEFTQVAFEKLDSNLYMMEPEKVANPEQVAQITGGYPILYIARNQYRNDHHNTATMFQNGEVNEGSFAGGSAMKIIDVADGGKVKTLLDCPEGIIRDPEISYDGKRVLFSMRKNKADDYHIYEMTLADKTVRQITFGKDLSDIDPNYLPNGKIVFSSTREPKYCMCNRHIMCNLYTMNADGSNMIQIGHSTLFEGHSGILSDGRIIYDRWEYVDRNFGDAQGLWVTNPDGTSHLLYYGNNTGAPGAFLEAREIPGTTKVVCTLGSCHDRPWGAIGILDRTKGIEGKDGVVKTWPAQAMDLINVYGSFDAMKQIHPKMEDPFPIDENNILVSRQLEGKGEKTGIYLLRMNDSELKIYEDENSGHGCFDPIVVAPREKQRLIVDKTDLSKKTGTFYVADVYIGTGMDAIPRGTAKWLRVVESPEKRFYTYSSGWFGQGEQAPGMNWDDFVNKRILGTVPIESDGSANFELPADTFVFFQILDEQGRMIQSMRSGTIVRPGENQGCIGCHEDRLNAVAPRRSTIAMMRAPSKLDGWYGPARNFSFTKEVQPVFDKHCVKCHDAGKPGAARICLAGDRNLVFNNSYYELMTHRDIVHVIGAGPAQVQNPRTWGSSVSRLADVVLNGHGVPERDAQLNLSQEDKDRVVTWLDLNAPYYPEYASSFGPNNFGRSPLTRQQVDELSKLTGINLGHQSNANKVWFDRPELSPCLQGLDKNSDAYKQALALIQEGRQVLFDNPRPDMPGCQLDERDQKYEDKYESRLEDERARVQDAAKAQAENR